jgi:hypothetical protein
MPPFTRDPGEGFQNETESIRNRLIQAERTMDAE